MSLTPQLSTVTVLPDQAKTWCIYEHWFNRPEDGERVLLYVGHCALVDVYKMIDATRNEHWRTVTARRPVDVVVKFTGAKNNCLVTYAHLLQTTEWRPVVKPLPRERNSRTRVKCDQTGITYASQNECAVKLGISQSSLSKHLRGETGYKAVNGYTFTAVTGHTQ